MVNKNTREYVGALHASGGKQDYLEAGQIYERWAQERSPLRNYRLALDSYMKAGEEDKAKEIGKKMDELQRKKSLRLAKDSLKRAKKTLNIQDLYNAEFHCSGTRKEYSTERISRLITKFKKNTLQRFTKKGLDFFLEGLRI